MTEVFVDITRRARLERGSALPPVPSYLTVFVNWACNLTCRECWLYGDSSDQNDWFEAVKRNRLSLEMWKQILQEVGQHVIAPSFSLMGGEPLIHPRIIELIEMAKSNIPGCTIDMSTNGTLLNRYAERLVASQIDTIYISLDGPTAEINDPIRGHGSFDRVLDGMAKMQSVVLAAGHGPHIALNFTLTGLNYETLPQMIELCEQLEVGQLTVDLGMYFSDSEGNGTQPAFEPVTGRPFTSWAAYRNEHQNSSVDQQRLLAVLEATTGAETVEVLVAPVRYSNEAKSQFFTDGWRDEIQETTCPKLWAQTTILPNGDVVSCTPFADTTMGSLATESLEAIWTGPRYRRMRALLTEQLQPICYRCCELSLDIGTDPDLYRRPELGSPQ